MYISIVNEDQYLVNINKTNIYLSKEEMIELRNSIDSILKEESCWNNENLEKTETKTICKFSEVQYAVYRKIQNKKEEKNV